MPKDSKPDALPEGVRPIPYDDDEEEQPYGDPSRVKDESPIESLGKAISEPVRGQAGDDAGKTPGQPLGSPDR